MIAWAKGSSQELFIYPPTSDFQKRDFLFRISLATVEAETSEFTPLPGIRRTLMLLKGEHTLTHKGHHTKQLFPFDQDTFEGDWQTSSRGQATNFNLMCREGSRGNIKRFPLFKEQPLTIDIKSEFALALLYNGQATVNNQKIENGEYLAISKGTNEKLTISCEESGYFILVSMDLEVESDPA